MLKLDRGDAQVWMDTAVASNRLNAPDPKCSMRRVPGDRWGNALNVAAVGAGYAFELVFKALVKVHGGTPKPVRPPGVAYDDHAVLAPADRDKVDRIAANHGWRDSGKLPAFLDEHLCDKDRKYWMRSPAGGPARGMFSFSGRKRLDVLKRLHRGLSLLALRRINERQGAYEDWPGIAGNVLGPSQAALPPNKQGTFLVAAPWEERPARPSGFGAPHAAVGR